MKPRTALLCFTTFLLAAGAGHAGPFGKDTIFQKLTGEWEGRGEFTDSDGKVTKIRETWTGKAEGESVFAMGGTRDWGEDGPHDFEWRFLYNPTTELIECEMTMSTMEKTVRFEVSIDEIAGTVSLQAPLGTEGGEVTVVNRVADGKIFGKVVLKDAGGNETASGTFEHRHPAEWKEGGDQ